MSIYKEIAQIVKVCKPRRFLEIGVQSGRNLLAIDCPYKVGIDPSPKIGDNFPLKIYKDTSDNAFASNEFKHNEANFDLIFIDGFHEFNQVVRDVENSLHFLSHDGLIICHDVYPFGCIDKYENLTDKECPGPQPWTGDVWKLVFYVRFCMLYLDFCVVSNFPGYLYLWRNTVLREKAEEEFDINSIDAFSVTNGMIHKNLMNIVSLERVWKCRNL